MSGEKQILKTERRQKRKEEYSTGQEAADGGRDEEEA